MPGHAPPPHAAPDRTPRSLARRVGLLSAIAALGAVTDCGPPPPCNGADLQSDTANCGACGSACRFGHGRGACIAGRCTVTACDPGWDHDPTAPPDTCSIDLQNSASDCGARGNQCAYQSGGEICVEGRCVCRPGQTKCGERCTALDVDGENCGACDLRCASGEACVEGACRALRCPPNAVLIPGGVLQNGVWRSAKVPAFCLQTREVTWSDWSNCVRAGRCPGGGQTYDLLVQNAGSLPVFFDGPYGRVLAYPNAAAYCAWAQADGRLPNRDEWLWEATGRAEQRTFPWGEELPGCEHGNWAFRACQCRSTWTPWCCRTGNASTPRCAPGMLKESNSPRPVPGTVGSHPAGRSRDGVEDLFGNVSELVSSCTDFGDPLGAYGYRGSTTCAPGPQVTMGVSAGAFPGIERIDHNRNVSNPPCPLFQSLVAPSLSYAPCRVLRPAGQDNGAIDSRITGFRCASAPSPR